jgi:hypothetical protein
MALVQYLYNIPSERRLAKEIPLNLAWLWVLQYNLAEDTPNHSVLSKARSRFGRQVYYQFFQRTVKLCQGVGLIKGDKVVMDATLIKADASRDSMVSRSLYQQLPGTPEEFVDRLWQENEEDRNTDEGQPTGENIAKIDEKATETAEDDKGTGKRRGKGKVNEERVSQTDPDAALIRDAKGALQLVHKVHMNMDGGEARVITAVTTTSGDICEAHELPYLLEQHRQNTGSQPGEAVADGMYGTEANYGYLKKAGVLPSIPRHETWSKQDVSNREFVYDKERDGLICPEGQLLKKKAVVGEGKYIRYRGSLKSCKDCQRKQQCTQATRRTVYRRADETVLNWAEAHLDTPMVRKGIKQRKAWIETANAELKEQHGLRRARYRRRWRVDIQAFLAATVYNLKKLVKYGGNKGNLGAMRSQIAAVTRPIFFCLSPKPAFVYSVSPTACS